MGNKDNCFKGLKVMGSSSEKACCFFLRFLFYTDLCGIQLGEHGEAKKNNP